MIFTSHFGPFLLANFQSRPAACNFERYVGTASIKYRG